MQVTVLTIRFIAVRCLLLFDDNTSTSFSVSLQWSRLSDLAYLHVF
jgi:hypothetical protein